MIPCQEKPDSRQQIEMSAKQACIVSLDDLIGEGHKMCWNLKTHGFRCFGIDDKLVARRLLDRQICPFRSLEYSVGESGGTAEQFVAIRAIRHQAAVAND